ncbi:hypothetical protein QJS66_20070 [Kocuria rhizophila]|nr:hypothetical protein QJS66_20070 [Kocuria rhizophila]
MTTEDPDRWWASTGPRCTRAARRAPPAPGRGLRRGRGPRAAGAAAWAAHGRGHQPPGRGGTRGGHALRGRTDTAACAPTQSRAF